MKKIFLVLITFLLLETIHASSDFSINYSKIFDDKESIINDLNNDYNLSYKVEDSNEKERQEITELSRKTTYLLLGDGEEETSEEYYKRYKEYLNLRYAPKIPEDPNSFTGFDEDSQEYKDDLLTGMVVPTLFLAFDELGFKFDFISNVRVFFGDDDKVVSMVYIPNAKLKVEKDDNPEEYEYKSANLIITYIFKKLNNEYKLYSIYGRTTDEYNEYFTKVNDSEDSEVKAINISSDSDFEKIYDYSKLRAIKEEEFNKISDSNASNIVFLSSHYNNSIVSNANGFFINDGLIVTTWSFMKKALTDSQYIMITDNNKNVYEMDGIVTINPESDIVVIKLKEKNSNKVTLGDYKNLKVEDPVITISSKSGYGLTIQAGIVISNDGYIQSAIPLIISDEGSPLFDSAGRVVGMNTSQSINTNVSIAVNSDALKEIQDKFNNIDFNTIKAISFEELKKKYYNGTNDEIVKNNVPTKKWKKYSKIGNVEKNIVMKLVKANYTNNIVSLRYYNEISGYMSSMQLAFSFKEELLKQDFKNTLDSNKKCIYENKDYKVIIMDEFDYLIIVMVRK